MKTTSLQVEHLTVQLSGKTILKDVSFAVHEGEVLAVVGKSGSGKSTLIKALSGHCFSRGDISFTARHNGEPRVVAITQQHKFKNLSNVSSFYYQQRFNSSDAEDTVSLNDVLQQITTDDQAIADVLSWLGITHVRYTRLIQLSNGEQKKLQLAKALLRQADWLLFDNPYTGLDTASRYSLSMIMEQLAVKGIGILLVTTESEIPPAVTHVAVLEKGSLQPRITHQEFDLHKPATGTVAKQALPIQQGIPEAYRYDNFATAVKMVNTNVTYGNKKILHNINWEVKRGECWRIAGGNGAGKSTLLSLVNGDNPQAFANEIYLFDRRKGSGESIWDIKQKIGYVSPELHQHFEPGATCFEVVASGLFDTIGLFRQLTGQQKKITLHWMELLQLTDFANRPLLQLSNGEQRLVLLTRAMVKNPPLLILDEPCQGLDAQMAAAFVAMVNDICTVLKKTLIYVSHYNEEVPSCVTRTLLLESGKIAA
ncbi:ATP-binding cassette domain-containing protein [Asinibacterium sp. OR53]|uniref:ATP-binding cassette domain-containing protein n=1 Tax=Asinibacterium sp. OR53 TaxID=925409 RepID=UPI00047ECD0C|nr:ATP-binding cassette domain-containing protein [Asinibacterium sp. OR53]